MSLRFQREEAVHLYNENLLPGFYDDWVQTEGERLWARYDQLDSLLTSAPFLTSAPLLPVSPQPD